MRNVHTRLIYGRAKGWPFDCALVLWIQNFDEIGGSDLVMSRNIRTLRDPLLWLDSRFIIISVE